MTKKMFGRKPEGGFRGLAAVMLSFGLVFSACDTDGGGGGSGLVIEPVYTDFYNYPDGRVNANGTLTISNSVAAPVLLFTSDVSPENYIGTAGSLRSVKVKLPEQKFYTIVAVDKANWQEKGGQAE